MKVLLSNLLLICFVSLCGCGPVRPVFHEGDNSSNYKSIFHEDVPAHVEVVNSVYVTYQPSFRPMTVTTADYEIELIASKQWIDKKAKKLWLNEASNEGMVRLLAEGRIKNRGREWFVPKDVSEYQIYIDRTSSMYAQMLVDKTAVGVDRYRVFLSKH